MRVLVLCLFLVSCVIGQAQRRLSSVYPTPKGFTRIETDSWGQYLRDFSVYDKNHICKDCYGNDMYETPQGAVLQMDLIGKDLQQCADACMRLRAEYLYGQGQKIVFHDVPGNTMEYQVGVTELKFRTYLYRVFSRANSYSLMHFDTKPTTLDKLKIGDMLGIGGFPGHVAMIMDIAVDNKGNYALLCAQSWMPAQEIEIVLTEDHEPWHIINKDTEEILVGVCFSLENLATWK